MVASEHERSRIQTRPIPVRQQAASIYPIVIESFGSGNEAPSQSNCSSYAGHMNCTATPGAYIPPRQVDVNANARGNEVRSCPQSKGYVSKPVNGPSKSNPPRSPKSEEDIADAISRFPIESASYVPDKQAAVSKIRPTESRKILPPKETLVVEY
jgi:hypothetical protein